MQHFTKACYQRYTFPKNTSLPTAILAVFEDGVNRLFVYIESTFIPFPYFNSAYFTAYGFR